MKVIVDTSVWSLALRRQKQQNNSIVNKLRDLISDNSRVVLLGAVRQEILSGIKHQEQFDKLKDRLKAFPNLELDAEYYELAADYFNICRLYIMPWRDRLRPIFMSAGTSVLGMLPLAVLPGKGAELYQGLGIALTGGLALSTNFSYN